MSDTFTICCPSCQAEYELPESLRDALQGKSVTCDSCAAPWVPLPSSGLLSKLRQPQELPIVLSPYLKSASDLFSLPDLEPSPAAAPAAPAASSPQAAAPAAPAVPSLHISARGPGLELDAVYELGRRSYLIGKSGCHLVLPEASIPDQAIRIRVADTGLSFEGIGGFEVPLGPVSVPSGRIQRGSASLNLGLDPYQVALGVSDGPGEAIADLEGSTPGTAKRASTGTDSLPQSDIRAQLPPQAPAAGGMDLQQTVRDFAAATPSTHGSVSWGTDVFKGFEVALVGTEGRYKDKSFRLTKSVTLVGRTSGDLVIPENVVSGKHAQLEVIGPGQYALKDFASTNGTTVNDRPVTQTALRNGDVIGFGGIKFKFIARPKS